MTVVIDKGHSQYGGSVIGRVIACPGSAGLNAIVPKRPEGPYAAEGTAAHYVAENCLKQNLPASHFLDFLYAKPGSKQIVVTGNMVDAVQVYLDEVNREMLRTDAIDTPDYPELFVEVGFDIESAAAPGEVWGSADAVVYHPSTGRLRIFDYKHGVGVSVSAEDNAQPKFYAMGAVFAHPDWRISEIICTICQPRARDAEETGAVKDWAFSVAELLEFQEQVETAISVSKKVPRDFPVSAFKTGPHCRWCDAAAVCPAREAEALAAATLDFADITQVTAPGLPEPKSLDTARLSAVVAGLNIVSDWMSQCQETLEGLVLSGVDVPGWKVVEKIGRAKWIEDPAKIAGYAEMMFGIEPAQFMPPKLVTITEAEKLIKASGASKDDIDTFKLAHTIKESSGLTVAQSSDRRPAVNAIEADFGTVKI